jgi:dTDP-4-amino-4,6-dideoxygalactose transaminase
VNIKYLDLKEQYKNIKTEIDSKIADVLISSSFISGKYVADFENNFAKFCGSKYCIAVNSGTAALTVSLKAIGVHGGDKILVPSNTFIASVASIINVGATPILFDCYLHTYNANIDSLIRMIEKHNPKYLMMVHMHGYIEDMDKILDIIKKYNIILIEDSCQSHGAIYDNKYAGTFGKVGCFSFYPGKNLGAYGEGGAIITDDEDVYNMCRMLRNHGSNIKYEHDFIGYNERMHGIQGAVLNVKLRYLKEWNKKRIDIAERYDKMLSGINQIMKPVYINSGKHVYHIYSIKCLDRDNLQKYLQNRGIETLIHYKYSIKELKPCCDLEGEYRNSMELASQMLSLPIYPELKTEEIEYICSSIREFYEN